MNIQKLYYSGDKSCATDAALPILTEMDGNYYFLTIFGILGISLKSFGVFWYFLAFGHQILPEDAHGPPSKNDKYTKIRF